MRAVLAELLSGVNDEKRVRKCWQFDEQWPKYWGLYLPLVGRASVHIALFIYSKSAIGAQKKNYKAKL